jgi:hypothetical protein
MDSELTYWLPPSRVKQSGNGDDYRGHELFANQAVEAFRQIFSEGRPIGVR